MKSFKLILAVLVLVLGQLAGAQTVVRGTVVDEHGAPLPGVNAHLMQATASRGGATSDAHGAFHFHIARAGDYRLVLSFVGFDTQTLSIKADGQTPIDLGRITMRESSEYLQSVEIVGRSRRDYISDYSFSATKMAIRNKDLPQVVTSITKELIRDRQAYQLSEAIKGASSVSQVGFYNHFNIRGITQNQQGQILNGMRTHQYYFLQPLTQNIERVEVIKGPSSITLSSTDPGGSINMVTKKPLKETRREVSLGVASYSTIRGALDFTGPINKDETILYRLNVAMQEAKSFRDLVRNDGLLISPSISYVPNERTAVNLELIYTDNTGNLDRGQPVFGKVTGKADLLASPISTNIAATGDYFRSRELIAITSLSQRLSSRLMLNAQYMRQTWDEDLKEHRTAGLVQDATGKAVPNLVLLRYGERKQHWNTDNLNVYLTYNWEIGKAKNTLLVGYDLNRLDKITGNSQLGARGYATRADGTTETIVYRGQTIKKPIVGFFDVLNPQPNVGNPQAYPLTTTILPSQLMTTHGAYIQSLTHVGRLTALLSLRHEWFKDVLSYGTPKESTGRNAVLLPRIGLSYELSKAWSLYATYLEGFQPQVHAQEMMPILANNFYGDPGSVTRFKPLRSNLIEAGIKTELLGGAIKSTLSLFQIDQDNVLVQVEDHSTISGYTFVERGGDRSRGIEWELSGYVLPSLQVSAAYSYIDAYIKKDPNPALIGQRKEATARHSASLWAKYVFPYSSPLSGLSLGAGVLYSGDKLSWYDRDLVVPAYTIADAVATYQPRGSRLEFTLKVNNLLNTVYWTGGINAQRMFPGAPRNYTFSTTYRF